MIIGLDWVSSMFQIPFLIPLFGGLTLSVVVGFRTAIFVTMLGAIPSFLQSFIDATAISFGGKAATMKAIEISQTCHGSMRCSLQSLGNPMISWLAQFLPEPSHPTPFIINLIALPIEFVFLVGFVYFAVRSAIRFRKDLKQRLGNKYRFKR